MSIDEQNDRPEFDIIRRTHMILNKFFKKPLQLLIKISLSGRWGRLEPVIRVISDESFHIKCSTTGLWHEAACPSGGATGIIVI